MLLSNLEIIEEFELFVLLIISIEILVNVIY